MPPSIIRINVSKLRSIVLTILISLGIPIVVYLGVTREVWPDPLSFIDGHLGSFSSDDFTSYLIKCYSLFLEAV